MTAFVNRSQHVQFKPSNWGEALQYERSNHAKTRHNVADRCGVNVRTVEDWEANKYRPQTSQLARLVTMLPAMKRYEQMLPLPPRKPLTAPVLRPEDVQAITGAQPAPLPPAPMEQRQDIGAQTFGPNTTFGEALAMVRLAAGLSRNDVGELLGVDASAVGHWEAGRNNPIRDHYKKLLEIFPKLALAKQPSAQDLIKPAGRPAGEGTSAVAPAAALALVPKAPLGTEGASHIAETALRFSAVVKKVASAAAAHQALTSERDRVVAEWDTRLGASKHILDEANDEQTKVLAQLAAMTSEATKK